ncbi:hypothetical protein GCM10017653_40050 [Ancylobacter defluvii]|uniref:Uncharacterized protein n=1 Tax=Ancylobacter defluvii TaxID=1282440 RepID=A0A9W6JXZ6_9HYPH|nr:hypothetical protein GCM10017653_40050 [Ancylobacter defluvii]
MLIHRGPCFAALEPFDGRVPVGLQVICSDTKASDQRSYGPMGIFMGPRVPIAVILCGRVMEGNANVRTQPCTRTKVRGWT